MIEPNPGVEDAHVDAVVAREVAGRRQIEIDRQRSPGGRRGRRGRARSCGQDLPSPCDVVAHPLEERLLPELPGEIVDRSENGVRRHELRASKGQAAWSVWR